MEHISIHALREEGDLYILPHWAQFKQFLSTPSVRRATAIVAEAIKSIKISIHALREEGGRPRTAASRFGPNFYPRPPRGGRPDPKKHRQRQTV